MAKKLPIEKGGKNTASKNLLHNKYFLIFIFAMSALFLFALYSWYANKDQIENLQRLITSFFEGLSKCRPS